jgi:VIT1/CCC1 family predicted Fe2+/Mn2+ transporter
MSNKPINQPANSESSSHSMAPLAGWGRSLAIATAILFCISSAFPAVAGFVKDTESWPKWWGLLDLVLAFFLALLALAILGLTQGKVNKQSEDASYHVYRILTHGIFALLVVFFLVGDRIVWSNCLTGFAWRAWLLFYCLPAWFTALSRRPAI